MQTNASITIRLSAAKGKASALVAKRSMLLDAANNANQLREKAEAALALKPDVESFLDALQNRLHQKAVGRFEELLTCIMDDVFAQGDRVSVELATKRQQAEASFSVGNGEHREDALHGRGGSVANVLSTGLRFIALGRSRLRRFIVLDEPDCWLSPDRVPAFMGVVATLSRETGIQVLLISHHDPAFFESCATLVMLKANRKYGLSVSDIGGIPPRWPDTGKEGILSISLTNFMAFKHATIPLSPGVTVLQGGNDIGKSSVVTALRSMIRGDARDTFIRHGEPSCRLTLDMGADGTVSWERFRKGSPKSRYTQEKGGQKVHDSPDTSPPDWLASLGFDCDGELDFQIGHQKKPVFLLGEPGSKQAAVLSVGRDASWLDAMRKRHRDDCRRDAAVAKSEGERLESLRRQWQSIEPVEAAKAGLDSLSALMGNLEGEAKAIERGEAWLGQLERLNALPRENLSEVPLLPNVVDCAHLSMLCGKLEKVAGLPDALMRSPPSSPELLPVRELLQAGVRLWRAMQADLIGALPSLPPLPMLSNADVLQADFNRLEMAARQSDELRIEKGKSDKSIADAGVEYGRIVKLAGGVCPTCGGVLSVVHVRH